MGYKLFTAGEEALASDVNAQLMSQTVPRFTNAAQRTSLLTAPVLNQLSILDDSPGWLWYWNGTAWISAAATQARFVNIAVGAPLTGAPLQFDLTPAIQIARPISLMAQLFVEAGITAGSGFQSIGINCVPSGLGTSVPPAQAPTSTMFIAGPGQTGILPFAALYRNVPANTSWHIRVNFQPGSGGSTMTVHRIWGVLQAMAPAQEF